MARKFLSFDPFSGLLTTTVEEDGKNHIIYDQDVQNHLDLAARCRNERHPDFDKKDDIRHVAFVPDVVIVKMLTEDHVNFYDKDQRPQVLKLLETKYPNCKTTTKRIA